MVTSRAATTATSTLQMAVARISDNIILLCVYAVPKILGCDEAVLTFHSCRFTWTTDKWDDYYNIYNYVFWVVLQVALPTMKHRYRYIKRNGTYELQNVLVASVGQWRSLWGKSQHGNVWPASISHPNAPRLCCSIILCLSACYTTFHTCALTVLQAHFTLLGFILTQITTYKSVHGRLELLCIVV